MSHIFALPRWGGQREVTNLPPVRVCSERRSVLLQNGTTNVFVGVGRVAIDLPFHFAIGYNAVRGLHGSSVLKGRRPSRTADEEWGGESSLRLAVHLSEGVNDDIAAHGFHL